jgi:hypothetical protein
LPPCLSIAMCAVPTFDPCHFNPKQFALCPLPFLLQPRSPRPCHCVRSVSVAVCQSESVLSLSLPMSLPTSLRLFCLCLPPASCSPVGQEKQLNRAGRAGSVIAVIARRGEGQTYSTRVSAHVSAFVSASVSVSVSVHLCPCLCLCAFSVSVCLCPCPSEGRTCSTRSSRESIWFTRNSICAPARSYHTHARTHTPHTAESEAMTRKARDEPGTQDQV